MWSVLRFLYMAFLPLAGVVVLSLQGWKTNFFIAFGIAIVLLIYAYLQAILISMEKKEGVNGVAMLRGLLPVAMVGLASGFQWDRWIVEQMVLEAGSFVLVLAICMMIKAATDGIQMMFVIFLFFGAPALGFLYLGGRALVETSDGELDCTALSLLVVAFAFALFDSWKRFRPYGIDNKPMDDLSGSGWQIACIIIWAMVTIIGIPALLV